MKNNVIAGLALGIICFAGCAKNTGVKTYDKARDSEVGSIVLFNGTSSAGKTAIINELQRIYGFSYGVVNLDNFLSIYNSEHPLLESENDSMTDERSRQILDAMYSHVKQLSEQGKNVFVDTVEFDDDYERNCSLLGCEQNLILKNVIKVLVYCPLDIIVDRVKKRGLEGEPRALNLVFGQFPAIYKLQESADEMVIDRIKTVLINAQLPLVREEADRMPKELGLKGVAIQKFNEERVQFFNDFVKQFRLDTLDEIVLVPKHPWDLVVNTGIHSPEEVAQEIVSYLGKSGHEITPTVFKVNSELYDQYVGNYRFEKNSILEESLILAISKEDNKLFCQVTGQGKVLLIPKSEDTFFNQVDAFEISFVKNEKGAVSKLILHQGGKDQVAERIE